jgi:predicted Zn-dependent protease
VRGYLDADLLDEASKTAESAVRLSPREPAMELALGKAFLSHSRPAESISYLRRADRLMPSQPDILIPLASALLQQRDPAEALAALERVQQASLGSAEYHYLKAQASFALGKKDAALHEIQSAKRRDPQNALYCLTLGRYYQKYGNQREAVTVLEEAERLAPDLPEIPYSLAVSSFTTDDFENAARLAEKALRLDSRFDRARFLLGLARFAQGRTLEAEEQLSTVLKEKPQNPFYQCFYGILLVYENRIPQAPQYFRKALELDPTYPLAHFQLGRILARNRQYEEAKSEFEKALVSQPAFPEAYYQLGHVYERLGQKEKASQALATFQRLRATEYSERQELMDQMRDAVEGRP